MRTFLACLLTILFLFAVLCNLDWVFNPSGLKCCDFKEKFIFVTSVIGMLIGSGISIKHSINLKNNELGENVFLLITGIGGGIMLGCIGGFFLLLAFPMVIWLLIYWGITWLYEKMTIENLKIIFCILGFLISIILPFCCVAKYRDNVENKKPSTSINNLSHYPYNSLTLNKQNGLN